MEEDFKQKNFTKKMEDEPKKMEDDLKKIRRKKGRRLQKNNFSKFLLNLGPNLSWGWLSSLRFLLYLLLKYPV